MEGNDIISPRNEQRARQVLLATEQGGDADAERGQERPAYSR